MDQPDSTSQNRYGIYLPSFCRVVRGGGCGMAVVVELVDMKVDGPTRLDFSEQVGDE